MENTEKIVELLIDFDNEEIIDEMGVEVISLVEDPAIETDFVYFEKMKFETYSDYPESARNNAKRALKWAEENGWGDCGTQVGKERANQLAKGEALSRDTIARMASFKRHQQHKDVPYSEGCGGLMWDAWGGTSGIEWAINKLEKIDKEEFVTPTESENHDDFIVRCMGELQGEYKDVKQRYAVCEAYWEKKTSLEKCDSCSTERLILSEEAQDAILEYASKNGVYIDDIEFSRDTAGETAKDIVSTVRSRTKGKPNRAVEEPKTYFKYTGPSAERKFCKAMMQYANSGKLFTKEQIDKMSSINGQFAPKGQRSYSVFEYAGGVNCKHYWQKVTVYKDENGKKVIETSDPVTSEENNAAKSQNFRDPSPYGSIANNARLNFSIDEEKKTIVGPVMIPDLKIVRLDENDEPYYVYFSKSTIRKMSEKFFKDENINNTDLNHDGKIMRNNTLLESWIKEDDVHDKSLKYGFNLPNGTWFASYRLSDETWELVKQGKIKGFSLAGSFRKKDDYSKDEELLQKIINILNNVEL